MKQKTKRQRVNKTQLFVLAIVAAVSVCGVVLAVDWAMHAPNAQVGGNQDKLDTATPAPTNTIGTPVRITPKINNQVGVTHAK